VGLYLGSEDAATDEQVVSALLKSVARGWNVIDTARNYRRGRAEAAVGEALVTLTSRGLRREQLFISTKAGYLSGAPQAAPVMAPCKQTAGQCKKHMRDLT